MYKAIKTKGEKRSFEANSSTPKSLEDDRRGARVSGGQRLMLGDRFLLLSFPFPNGT
jgi:hypothetical protein